MGAGRLYSSLTELTWDVAPFSISFYEQAFRPVPQENSLFVEQAGKPVVENGARCELTELKQKMSSSSGKG